MCLWASRSETFYLTNGSVYQTRLSFFYGSVSFPLKLFQSFCSQNLRALWKQETFHSKTKPKKLPLLSHVRWDYFNCNIRASSVFFPSLFSCNLMRCTTWEETRGEKKGNETCSYHHEIFINRQQQKTRNLLRSVLFRQINSL